MTLTSFEALVLAKTIAPFMHIREGTELACARRVMRIRINHRDITTSHTVRIVVCVLLAVLMAPTVAVAQSPWERAALNLATTFTGPLARSLSLVSIVIGGLMFMFGEAGAKRQISGIVFGGGLALFAGQFLTWLF